MESKKRNIYICIIIFLAIIVLFLVYFAFFDRYDVVSGENIGGSTSGVSDVFTGIYSIPSDLTNYYLIHWDYDKLYNYYFMMNDVDKNINNIEKYNYIKLDNNLLYWNIDGKWVRDSIISSGVKYFNLEFNQLGGTDHFLVVTDDNLIYFISFDEVPSFSSTSLTSEIYNQVEYKKINAMGNINKVSEKYFNYCESVKYYYFDIDNKIYVLNNKNVLEDVNSFLSNLTITDLDNGCEIGNFLKIRYDGTIDGIYDENYKLIDIKYYIYIKDDEEYYNVIIDKDNYLYVIDEKSKYQRRCDKVISFKYNKNEYGKISYNIDLMKNGSIIYDR